MLTSFSLVADNATKIDVDSANRIDSLQSLLESTSTIQDKNEIYLSLANEYMKPNDSLSLVYCQKVLQSNPSASNFHLGKAHYLIGLADVNENEFAKSVHSFEKAIKYFELVEDLPYSELGSSYLNLGRAKRFAGNYYLALKNFTKALDFFNEADDQPGVAGCTNHIGIIYSSLGNHDKAREYYLKCEEIYKLYDDNEGRVYLLNNIGYLEEEAGNVDQALQFYGEGLDLARSIDFVMMEIHLMSNVANANINAGNFEKAEQVISKGMQLSKEHETNRLYQFFKISNAKLTLKRDESTKFKKEALEVLDYAKEKEFKFLESVTENVLKDMYLLEGNYKQAYYLSEKLETEKDSINSKQVSKELAFLDSKLKYEEQLNVERLVDQRNQFSKKLIYAVSLFLLLTILLSSYFVRRLKRSNDILKDKNKLLERKDADLKKSSKELEMRNEKLQLYIESNTQLEKFARATSHDIKTPLRTIASFAGLLAKRIKPKLDEKESEYLSYIIDGTERLGVITSDLLNSSVHEEAVNLEYFNLRDLIDNNLQDLAYVIQQTNTKVHVGDLPLEIYADKIKIRRVLQNLLENAIKYASPGISPVICINCRETELNYEFSISDNGIGIDRENHEQVFKTFSRVHDSSQDQGVGLGLSICKNNIEKHGGKIWINPAYNNGTEFCFSLPKEYKSS